VPQLEVGERIDHAGHDRQHDQQRREALLGGGSPRRRAFR
jgi:hypothetical protein